MDFTSMEFWGVEVRPYEKLKVIVPANKCLHVSEVALGSVKNREKVDDISLMAKPTSNGRKFVVRNLSSDCSRKVFIDLAPGTNYELSHTWKDGSVYLCGEYETLYRSTDDIYNGLEKEDYINGLVKAEKHKKSLLVTNLSLRTTEQHLKEHFGMFGDVNEVHLNYKIDNIYTLTAVVKMQSSSSIVKIKNSQHTLHKKCLNIVKYRGKRALENQLIEGRYKLTLKGLKFTRTSDYIRDNNRAGKHFQKLLAYAFDDLACTSVRLEMVDYIYSGGAEVWFEDGEDKSRVMQRVKDVLHCEASLEDIFTNAFTEYKQV